MSTIRRQSLMDAKVSPELAPIRSHGGGRRRSAGSCTFGALGEEGGKADTVLDITPEELMEVRTMKQPPWAVRCTLEMTCLILDATRQSVRPAAPSWENVQKVIADASFVSRVMTYDVSVLQAAPALVAFLLGEYFGVDRDDSINTEARPSGTRMQRANPSGVLRRRVSQLPPEPLTVARVYRANRAAAALFSWCHSVLTSAGCLPTAAPVLDDKNSQTSAAVSSSGNTSDFAGVSGFHTKSDSTDRIASTNLDLKLDPDLASSEASSQSMQPDADKDPNHTARQRWCHSKLSGVKLLLDAAPLPDVSKSRSSTATLHAIGASDVASIASPFSKESSTSVMAVTRSVSKIDQVTASVDATPQSTRPLFGRDPGDTSLQRASAIMLSASASAPSIRLPPLRGAGDETGLGEPLPRADAGMGHSPLVMAQPVTRRDSGKFSRLLSLPTNVAESSEDPGSNSLLARTKKLAESSSDGPDSKGLLLAHRTASKSSGAKSSGRGSSAGETAIDGGKEIIAEALAGSAAQCTERRQSNGDIAKQQGDCDASPTSRSRPEDCCLPFSLGRPVKKSFEGFEKLVDFPAGVFNIQWQQELKLQAVVAMLSMREGIRLQLEARRNRNEDPEISAKRLRFAKQYFFFHEIDCETCEGPVQLPELFGGIACQLVLDDDRPLRNYVLDRRRQTVWGADMTSAAKPNDVPQDVREAVEWLDEHFWWHTP